MCQGRCVLWQLLQPTSKVDENGQISWVKRFVATEKYLETMILI